MMLARGLRLAAVLIALAGVADPVLVRTASVRQSLAIIVLQTDSDARPVDGRTRADAAQNAASRLHAALAREFDVTIFRQRASADAAACPTHSACIVISDAVRPERIGTPRSLAGVTSAMPLTPNVAIQGVEHTQRAQLTSMSRIDVHLTANGIGKARTELIVYDGATPVGWSSHEWPADSNVATQDAVVPVEWTPASSGLRDVRVVATPLREEETPLDNEVRLAVEVDATRADVLVFEPRPSSASTFVRRAIERDPRLHVRSETRVSRNISVAANDVVTARLDDRQVRRSAVVLVGAPEMLSHDEVTTLERFMRVRGGSVIVLPDARPTGPIQRLFPGTFAEHRGIRPIALGQLRASEFLTFQWPALGTTTIAAHDAQPVIVSHAMGRGRLIVSGALDAWRFRDENAQFGRFWQALVADAAGAVPARLNVVVQPSRLRPGENATVTAEWIPENEAPAAAKVEAALTCEQQPQQVVRMWPAGSTTRFVGNVRPQASGACRVEVRLTEPTPLQADAPLLITLMVPSVAAPPDTLTGAISAHGGHVVGADEIERVISEFRAQRIRGDTAPVETRPLRSPWWILAFAGCLGGEWWLRRRAGLR